MRRTEKKVWSFIFVSVYLQKGRGKKECSFAGICGFSVIMDVEAIEKEPILSKSKDRLFYFCLF